MEKSWQIGKKIVMEIENSLNKLWQFSTAYHESSTRSSDNSVSTALICLWEAFGLTPYFQFERRRVLLFVYVMNTHR